MGPAIVAPAVIPRGLGCVLVVEDEFLIRMLIADELRDEGCHVIEANSADEAIEVLRGVTPDVIISDVQMQGTMDGIGLLGVVRDAFPALPVIIISGHVQSNVALAAGANQFVAKPFKVGSMVEAVRRALEGSH